MSIGKLKFIIFLGLVIVLCQYHISNAEWKYNWNYRTDQYDKPAGIFTTTPFLIDETMTSYSITNDDGTKTYMLGNKYFVDNSGNGCTNGNTLYNPSTRTCGSGSYTVYTTIAGSLSAITAGNKTILVRDGTYYENNLVAKAGTDDTHRFNIIGYKQERPIVDGQNSSYDVFARIQTTNAYVTFQRLKVQNNKNECFRFGNYPSKEGSYINLIDIETYNCNNDKAYTDGNIHFYGSDYAWIYHNTTHRTYGHCIKIPDSASNAIVEWTVVYECGWWSGISETTFFNKHSIGIDFSDHNTTTGDNNIVRYNIAYDTLFYTLHMNNNKNFSVHHNEFYSGQRCYDIMTDTLNSCYSRSEGNFVAQIVGESGGGYYGRFYSNVIRNSRGHGNDGEWGLFQFFGSSTSGGDIYFYNNLLYDDSNSEKALKIAANVTNVSIYIYNNSFYMNNNYTIIDDAYAGTVDLKNNIFYQNGTGRIIQGTNTHSYNRYAYPNGSRGVTLGTGDTDGDPYWRVLPSGAIDTSYFKLTQPFLGINLSSQFNDDVNGKVRVQWNMGAYEYFAPLPPIGLRIIN